jgi:SAM-dependent methyltransferase
MLTRTLRRVRTFAAGLHLGGHEAAKLVWAGYKLALGRAPELPAERDYTAALVNGRLTPAEFLTELTRSDEYRAKGRPVAPDPLHALHAARVLMVKGLPPAEVIVDLGGGASQNPAGALVMMGYPYPFRTLTVVEPPADDRHDWYKDVAPGDVGTHDTGRGVVNYLYSSMADLTGIADASVDLVFSGESVEHVSRADFERVLAETRRVLKPSGWFCFDTPNRAITRVQYPDGGFINPDHKYEYTHPEVVDLLHRHGFAVTEAKGISWCPSVRARGEFDLADIVAHVGVYDAVEECYLLYYRCRPAA